MALSGCGRAGERYDLILTGGSVIDGSGSDAFAADVAIHDGRIAAVGDLASAAALERLDVTGLVVTPGFIDAHSHAVLGEEWGQDARPFLARVDQASVSEHFAKFTALPGLTSHIDTTPCSPKKTGSPQCPNSAASE